jgi:hypothetical protein
VRLGATAVVRLEGALAHEDLRLLASAHRGESAPHPMVGLCCLRRPQSALPWRSGWRPPPDLVRGARELGAMGMRKRSQTRSINDTGAAEGRSNPPESNLHGGRRRPAQADTPMHSRSVDDLVVGTPESC